jgi:hypothetical protein
LTGYERRFTGDWAKDNERRAAGQEKERQPMADYYARLTVPPAETDSADQSYTKSTRQP